MSMKLFAAMSGRQYEAFKHGASFQEHGWLLPVSQLFPSDTQAILCLIRSTARKLGQSVSWPADVRPQMTKGQAKIMQSTAAEIACCVPEVVAEIFLLEITFASQLQCDALEYKRIVKPDANIIYYEFAPVRTNPKPLMPYDLEAKVYKVNMQVTFSGETASCAWTGLMEKLYVATGYQEDLVKDRAIAAYVDAGHALLAHFASAGGSPWSTNYVPKVCLFVLAQHRGGPVHASPGNLYRSHGLPHWSIKAADFAVVKEFRGAMLSFSFKIDLIPKEWCRHLGEAKLDAALKEVEARMQCDGKLLDRLKAEKRKFVDEASVSH